MKPVKTIVDAESHYADQLKLSMWRELVEALEKCARALAAEYGVPYEECIGLEVGEARAVLAKADTLKGKP